MLGKYEQNKTKEIQQKFACFTQQLGLQSIRVSTTRAIVWRFKQTYSFNTKNGYSKNHKKAASKAIKLRKLFYLIQTNVCYFREHNILGASPNFSRRLEQFSRLHKVSVLHQLNDYRAYNGRASHTTRQKVIKSTILGLVILFYNGVNYFECIFYHNSILKQYSDLEMVL